MNLARIAGLPEELVTDLHVQPCYSGGAILSWKAGGLVHYGWYWPPTNTLKLLEADIFPGDWRKDADGVVWTTPDGLAAIVSHTTDEGGTGASARLYGGTMPAEWVRQARAFGLVELIKQQSQASGTIDQQARDLITQAMTQIQALETELAAVKQRLVEAGGVLKGVRG